MLYSLVNKHGGFLPISAEQYRSWQHDPAEAVRTDPGLLEQLHWQTHDRGFDYADFTAVKAIA